MGPRAPTAQTEPILPPLPHFSLGKRRYAANIMHVSLFDNARRLHEQVRHCGEDEEIKRLI